MKTKLTLLAFLLCAFVLRSNATHLLGGELSYVYLGGDEYEITLKVYRDCGPDNVNGTGFDTQASVGIYSNGSLYENVQILLDPNMVIELPTDAGPCLEVPPEVCVEEATYIATITLPENAVGYDLVYQRCCRSPAIINLNLPEDTGNTLWAQIPPASLIPTGNSSPHFEYLPPGLLCANQPFSMDHSAFDADGDVLIYSLCDPFHGASFAMPQPSPPTAPPYTEVTWATGFDAQNPITASTQFTINEVSGILTGTPTQPGKYAVGVCVQEWRNNQLLSTVIRDFMFHVVLCEEVASAAIVPQDQPCEGTYFEFGNVSQGAFDVLWDFGVQGIDSDTSDVFEPEYNFPDTGTYAVTLIVNPGEICADTVVQMFTAYPELTAEFDLPEPFCAGGGMAVDLIGDGTFGENAEFSWDFDGPVNEDSSELFDPNIIVYSQPGSYDVTFTIYNENCTDAITQAIEIPPFPVAAIQPQTNFCSGLDYNFFNASSGASSYLWDFGVSGSADFSNEENPSFTYPNFGNYYVTLIVDPGSDCQDSTHLDVIVSPEDPVVIAYDIDPGNPCDTIPGMTADFIGWNVDDVSWDMGDGTILDGWNIAYEYDEAGTYTVVVDVYYELCDIQKSEEIEVFYQTDALDEVILMPNVFSPNDDIWNERVRPFYKNESSLLPEGRTAFDYIDDYHLRVYNRWGVELFDSSGGVLWWDGRIAGEIAEEGTYYYTVTYKEQCADEAKTYSGSVLLLHK